MLPLSWMALQAPPIVIPTQSLVLTAIGPSSIID